jgi:hypothetical protein
VSGGTQGPAQLPPPAPTGLSPSVALHSSQLRVGGRHVLWGCSITPRLALQPPRSSGMLPIRPLGFGLLPLRSPLLGECSLFLAVLRCFTSRGSLHVPYVFRHGCDGMTHRGLPHSDIAGSPRAGRSPARIAAGHVLPRPGAPRHPPLALAPVVTGSRLRQDPTVLSSVVNVLPLGAPICAPPAGHGTWRRGDSNSCPPACKAGALPAELRPPLGPAGLEPAPSALSGQRSHQLSYRPPFTREE